MLSLPDAARRGGLVRRGPHLWRVVDFLYVVASFLPYLALPLGASTNIPLTSLLAPLWLPRALRYPRLLAVVGLLAFAPLVTGYFGMLVGRPVSNPFALVTWAAYVLPVAVIAVLVIESSEQVVRAIAFGAGASALFVLFQQWAIARGTVPFLAYYDMPGYAAIRPDLVVNYIRRPFGLFPEPSFMAGTLALATTAMVLLLRASSRRLAPVHYAVVALVLTALVVSRSGSAVVAGLVLLGVVLAPHARGLRWPLVFGAVGTGGAFVAAQILERRSSAVDFSWSDRSASIVAAFAHTAEDPVTALLGVGRGHAAHLFSTGEISLSSFEVVGAVQDIYSVLGRVAVEAGFVCGVVLIVSGYAAHRGAHAASAERNGRLVGLLAGVLWVVVAGLTISYDSAAWIWLSLGIALGVRLQREDGGGLEEPDLGEQRRQAVAIDTETTARTA